MYRISSRELTSARIMNFYLLLQGFFSFCRNYITNYKSKAVSYHGCPSRTILQLRSPVPCAGGRQRLCIRSLDLGYSFYSLSFKPYVRRSAKPSSISILIKISFGVAKPHSRFYKRVPFQVPYLETLFPALLFPIP